MRSRSSSLLMPWLFALLLICMQQFALLHPYSHNNDWQKTTTNQTSDQKDSIPHTTSCAQCLAIAGIDHTVASHALAIHNASEGYSFNPTLPMRIVVNHFQAYLSRAPPSLT
jgi:hypothetical protein